ncbi:MAG: radical SAM protein [Clostridia bacterium]|nr:radical SAM protein [Clostridia bacterium]
MITLKDAEEYAQFSRLSANENAALKNEGIVKNLEKYQQMGYLQENCVTRIEHPEVPYLEYYLQNRIQYLILQVTQQCNLRCGYCIYSGAYPHQRTHSVQKVTWETAKEALDYYLEHSTDASRVTVGFYGGEPLLALGLIKRCVQYVKDHVKGKKIAFHITTNGTLLDPETFAYLNEQGFQILISLDGGKTEHDRNRRFVDGTGSFDVIMNNIRRIRELYPEDVKTIMFNAVMTPQSDLSCMMETFRTDEVLSDHHVMFNDVADALGDDPEAHERFWSLRRFEYLKFYLALGNKLPWSAVSPMAERALSNLYTTYEQMQGREQMTSCMHHNGPCVAGSARLFVTTNGDLYPCQNVSELYDYFRIGNLRDGIDVEKVRRLVNNGIITENRCIDCWKLRLCSICSQNIKFGGKTITEDDKMVNCRQQEGLLLDYLMTIAILRDLDYEMDYGAKR